MLKEMFIHGQMWPAANDKASHQHLLILPQNLPILEELSLLSLGK
jgi:hypothetical protein